MEEVRILGVENGALNVSLSGEIDFGKAESFYEDVMESYASAPVSIVFDCADLEFIDSTTLGTFVKILKVAQKDGNGVKLLNLQPKIKKLFVICALDRLMEIA